MAHTRNPGYRPGSHWVECDVCGFDYKQEEMRERWDGMVVCKKDFETRHPQDFVRSRHEDTRAKGLVRPDSSPEVDAFDPTTDPNIPDGTFTNEL